MSGKSSEYKYIINRLRKRLAKETRLRQEALASSHSTISDSESVILLAMGFILGLVIGVIAGLYFK